MEISSPDFEHESVLSHHYALGGDNISPQLRWTSVPAQAKSLAVLVEDPDAPRGTWFHWAIYDLPISLTELPRGAGTGDGLPRDAKQGKNSWGEGRYQGPQPPPGQNHRYYFKVYALDVPALGLPAGAKAAQVKAAVERHSIAEASTMGYFPAKR